MGGRSRVFGFRRGGKDLEIEGGAIGPFLVCNSGTHTVYTVLARPCEPWFVGISSRQCAWVRALEWTCQIAEGCTTPTNALEQLVDYCFYNHELLYDVENGSPHYLSKDGVFNATGYINKSGGLKVNCFDQGNAINVFGALLGIETQVVVMRPFGYLRGTYLVGRGFCNNPFYENADYSSFNHTIKDIIR